LFPFLGRFDPGCDRVLNVLQRFFRRCAVGRAAGELGHGGEISAAVAFCRHLGPNRIFEGSSPELLVHVHSPVDNADNHNPHGFDDIEDELCPDNNAAESGQETVSFPAYEWKPAQIPEFRVELAHERVGRGFIPLGQIRVDMQQFFIRLVGLEYLHRQVGFTSSFESALGAESRRNSIPIRGRRPRP
jgi:hypothetical protein